MHINLPQVPGIINILTSGMKNKKKKKHTKQTEKNTNGLKAVGAFF